MGMKPSKLKNRPNVASLMEEQELMVSWRHLERPAHT